LVFRSGNEVDTLVESGALDSFAGANDVPLPGLNASENTHQEPPAERVIVRQGGNCELLTVVKIAAGTHQGCPGALDAKLLEQLRKLGIHHDQTLLRAIADLTILPQSR
jgi:hypothetical protein